MLHCGQCKHRAVESAAIERHQCAAFDQMARSLDGSSAIGQKTNRLELELPLAVTLERRRQDRSNDWVVNRPRRETAVRRRRCQCLDIKHS